MIKKKKWNSTQNNKISFKNYYYFDYLLAKKDEIK